MLLALDLPDILVQEDTALDRHRHNMFLVEGLEQVAVDIHGVVTVVQNIVHMLLAEECEVSLLEVDFFSDILLDMEDILVESEEVLQPHV